MSVNGVTSAANAYTTYATTNQTKTKNTAATAASASTDTSASGVIYESSANSTTAETATGSISSATDRSAIIAQLQADAEERSNQLQSLVQQMITKQGNSYGQATDMWQFLASGDYTVDAATKAQAQEDTSEDGYWSVDKTSDRILDFAKALCGDDTDKLEEMRSAFEKGFKQATSAWGKELPSISQSTYDSVMKKFDDWAAESSSTTISE